MASRLEESVHHYTYNLPDERIARYPLEERDSAKMLVWKAASETIENRHVRDLDAILDRDSLIILNNSKVIPARLHFRKVSGSPVELFLLEPLATTHQQALESRERSRWFCLFGAKRLREGSLIECNSEFGIVQALILERRDQGAVVELSWPPGLSLAELLERIGNTPLPPYLNRPDEQNDKERYQTVFARNEGSVAAPTAALHLSSGVLNRLENKGIRRSELTLHVGLGTFQPMKSDHISDHSMHEEIIEISRTCLEDIAAFLTHKAETPDAGHRFVCVGTTSLRSIESLFWLALSLYNSGATVWPETARVEQWCWRNSVDDVISPLNAIQYLLNLRSSDGSIPDSMRFRSSLMISPGYDFRYCDTLMTNFHQPQSTLLVLVSAFCGDEARRKIYEHALKNDYRFLSYGDSSLLFR